MKKIKTKKRLLWILTFLPLIVTLIVLPALLDTIPAHFGVDGAADRWGSKYEALIIPLITIALMVFVNVIGRCASKQKSSATQNQKVLVITNYMLVLVFNGLTYWMLYSAYMNIENLYK